MKARHRRRRWRHGFLEISQILLTLREREIGRQLIHLTQELRLLRLAQFLVLFQRYLWRGRQFVHDWQIGQMMGSRFKS